MTPWSNNHSEIRVNGAPWCDILHTLVFTLPYFLQCVNHANISSL